MKVRAAAVLVALVCGYAVGTLLIGGAAAGMLGEAAQVGWPGRAGGAGLDPALGVAAAVVSWCVLTWLVAVTGLAVAAEVSAPAGAERGHVGQVAQVAQVARRRSPLLVRRTVALLLGAGLAGALGGPGPAHADPSAGPVPATLAVTAAVTVDRPGADLSGWTPDRPIARPLHPGQDVRLVTTVPSPDRPAANELVVRRGDSLWAIAARHLGAGAGAAEIAAEWPRWYAENRERIGPDPDLLRPGQRLRAP